jgi:hypothetical protein
MKHFMMLLLGTTLIIAGCSSNTSTSEEATAEEETTEQENTADAGEWQAKMDAYHDVMSDVFHSAEEDNLMPLKDRADELADRASEWAALEIPETESQEMLRSKMAELRTGSEEISLKVAEEFSDQDLKDAIFALHDVYHDIVGLCEDMES